MNKETEKIIKEFVTENEVFLFMKGSPEMPQCGFSFRVVQVLEELEVPFSTCNVLEHQDIREGIKIYSDWPTIPQLYVRGEFIGGCEIIEDLYRSGELQKILSEERE